MDTRPRACVRVVAEACRGGSPRVQASAAMVIGEAVRTCGWRCSVVQWSELVVEMDCGGQSQ
jgi:hypothetical protein